MVYGGQGHLVLRIQKDATQNGPEKNEADLDAIAETTLRRCALNDKSLRSLDISNAIFASRFFSQLGDAMQHNTVLQELYLDNCRVDDDALRNLSRGIEHNGGRVLRALSLEDNLIKCVGAGHLARLLRGRSRWARTFGGYKTHAAGPGIGLQYLSLKGNAIGAAGCRSIAEALACSDDSLERLSLEANRIDDWGAGWFAMALRNHNVLQHLDLHRNPIGLDGIEELKGACENAKASLVLLKPRKEFNAPAGRRYVLDDSDDEEEEAEETVMEAQEDVEDEEKTMVAGQRLATVYVTEVSAKLEAHAGNSGYSTAASSRPTSAARSQSTGAFSRPGSASRRAGQVQRHNGQLDIGEPSGGVMLDSAPAFSARTNAPVSEAGSPPRSRPGSAARSRPGSASRSRPGSAGRNKLSAPGLAASLPGGDLSGALRASMRRAVPLGQASTYNMASERESELKKSARCNPGEREAFVEEMETATGLAPPSRWRRKLSAQPARRTPSGRTSMGGCGARAAQGLRRSQSTPGNSKRCGMLMGPTAASGVYGCAR